MRKIIYTLYALLLANYVQGQAWIEKIELSTYIESYYNYDFNQPKSNEIPGFLYNFNRHNEVNLNIGFIQASYISDEVRANLALMTGTYANVNLADEPDVMKNIFRANAGVKLTKNHQLWLDAGIFDSHIGFESAIGANNLTLSRSIMAENSPYYLAGVKLSYTSSNKLWDFSLSYLNGWQRIQRVEGNSSPAFGHQITYQPNKQWSFNSSSFVGNDFPDEFKKNRYFHNFYTIYQPNMHWKFIFGLDSGWQQKEKGSSQYSNWFSPNLIAQYQLNEKSKLAGRVEYFDDQDNVIIASDLVNNFGFQVSSYSLTFDYQITSLILWRIEARHFLGNNELFQQNNELVKDSFFITSSLAIKL